MEFVNDNALHKWELKTDEDFYPFLDELSSERINNINFIANQGFLLKYFKKNPNKLDEINIENLKILYDTDIVDKLVEYKKNVLLYKVGTTTINTYITDNIGDPYKLNAVIPYLSKTQLPHEGEDSLYNILYEFTTKSWNSGNSVFW